MVDETADATRDDDSGVSRRSLIKRAAIVGGVVAWTAPTIQMLGQNTAWAAKAKKLPPGSVTVCGSGGAKPGRLVYSWEGGTCAAHPNTCAANCACSGADNCSGTVYITVTGGVIDQASVDPPTAYDGPTQVHGDPGNLNFAMSKTDNNQTFTVRTGSHLGPICQFVQLHVSCSQTPPVQPGYQIGGLLLFDWAAS
jgi:hypothetical protein